MMDIFKITNEIPEVSIAGLVVPDAPIFTILTLVSGIFWTAAYINIIYRGFKDKTCGMPLLVLGLNISWEFIFAFMGEPFFHMGNPLCVSWQATPQRWVNAVWFIFDCVILYLKFKYGRDEYNKALPGFSNRLFIPYVVLIVFVSFMAVISISVELDDHQGAYAAYQQNIFISSLFIPMMLRKGSTDGQSMYIAIFKCLGTVAPSVMGAIVCIVEYGITLNQFLLFSWMPYMKMLVFCCLVFDLIYIISLYKLFKKEGKNPWTRKPLNPAPAAKEEA